MIILGPSSVSSVNDRIKYQLYPVGIDPFTEADLSNETGITFQVTIGGNVYLLSPQSTVRYPIEAGVTFIELKPLTSPAVTGSVYGIAYTSTDPKPSQVARGSNFLGGAVGLPIDPLVLGASNSIVLGTQASGDTVDRWKIWADGTQQWGPGNAAVDTQLGRTGVAQLTLTGSITLSANLTVVGGTLLQSTVNTNGPVNVGGALSVGTTATVSGALVAKAADNFFGTGASGLVNGSRIRLSAAADANVYVMPESIDLANIDTHIRQKGTGRILLETGAGAPLLTLIATGSTFAGPLTITSGGLDLNTGTLTGVYQINLSRAGGGIRDSTSGDRVVYFDGSTVYVGSVDGSRPASFRGAGLDALLAEAGGNLWTGGNFPGTTHVSNQVNNTSQIFGGRGFGINNDGVTYQGGSTVGISIAINRSDPALTVLNGIGESIQTYGGGYNKMFALDSGPNLFSLDTPIFLRWVNGTGGYSYSQVRLATGATIRTGGADTRYFLGVV